MASRTGKKPDSRTQPEHKRVWILGAGASESYGCPSNASLLEECLSVEEDYHHSTLLQKCVRLLYPGRAQLPEVDELLGLLIFWAQLNGIQRPYGISSQQLHEAHDRLLQVVRDILREPVERMLPEDSFARWAACLKPDDTVISFNWDLGLEHCLSDLRDKPLAYQYLPGHGTRRLTLLKPHGSTNWYPIRARGDETAAPLARDLPLLGAISGLGSPESSEAQYGAKTPLILASYCESYGPAKASASHDSDSFSWQRSQLEKRLWSAVYKSLYEADEIYVIGYSFPATDKKTAWTIRAAIMGNLAKSQFKTSKKPGMIMTVINPDASTRTRYQELFGRDKGIALRFLRKPLEKVALEELVKTD